MLGDVRAAEVALERAGLIAVVLGAEHGCEERLAESTRIDDERIFLVASLEGLDPLRLVNVGEAFGPDFFEVSVSVRNGLKRRRDHAGISSRKCA